VQKNVEPKNKKRKSAFLKEVKDVRQCLVEDVVDKYTELFKPNEKILKQNYCLSVHDNVGELWLFVRVRR